MGDPRSDDPFPDDLFPALDMDELWAESVKESREHAAATRAWVEQEVYRAIRDLRIAHGAYSELKVIVGWCSGCIHFESRALETDTPAPDILRDTWKSDFRWAIGADIGELRQIFRGLFRDGWSPRCWQCGSDIDLDEGVYTKLVDLSSYFDLYVSGGRIPKWMKQAVRAFFGTVCGECGGPATTLDHIVARARGGLTEVVNLQPLCAPCNGKKAAQAVDLTTIVLSFPLRPPPSEGFEGIIW